MRARRALVALLVVVAAGEASVRAGVQDTPLPTFSDGQAAQLAALIPGAIKDNNVETVVICTNLAPAPLCRPISRTTSVSGTPSACTVSRSSSYATTHVGSPAASGPAESTVAATTSAARLTLDDTASKD